MVDGVPLLLGSSTVGFFEDGGAGFAGEGDRFAAGAGFAGDGARRAGAGEDAFRDAEPARFVGAFLTIQCLFHQPPTYNK
jgi:hypothetical protein